MLRRLAAAAALAAELGCSHAQRTTAETTIAKALVSDEQEKQIGLQTKQQLEQQENLKYVQDPQVVGFVEGITKKLFPLAEKDRPGVDWKVFVIDDPKTVNAFATPGGFLYVYSGLLLAASNPAEVAGVMAHEVGHVVGRHSARQMVEAYGLQSVLGLALGKDPGVAAQVAAGVAGKGAMLANSRSDETEADEYGARYASGAGYDPHALITFFEKLKANEGNSSFLMRFLSDHPLTADRISHLQAYIEDHGLGASGGTAPGPLPAVQARIPQAPKAAA